MKIKFFLIIGLICLFLIGRGQVLASGFNLTHIGNLSTADKQISHWWYTGLNPTFKGEALAGSQVDIVIDDQSYQAGVDEFGQWFFTSLTELGVGDHAVSLTNSGSTISFTLTLGSENVNWESIDSSGSGESLPAAGVMLPTLILTGMGGGLALVGRKMWK